MNPGTGRSVFSREEAERLAVAYSPRKFPTVVTPAAKDFVAFQSDQAEAGTDPVFRIDKIVAEQTGVAELERASIEERVEREAIGRLKELQESAYQQAYQLGLDEGREKAFVEQRDLMAEKIQHLDSVIGSIETLKKDLVSFNESHLVKLVYSMARRLLMSEIEQKREIVLEVIKQAIESAQSDENVTVRVSATDYAFIEEIKERLGKGFEAVKAAKFEPSDEIADGGCVIETNYGDVDATVEQRLETLWSTLVGKLPKVKSVVATPGDSAGGDGTGE